VLVSAVSGEPTQDWVSFAPGEEGVATLALTPKGFGDWTKTYTVESNDPARGKLNLTLSAEIKPRVHVEPRLLDLGTVSPATDTTLVATIRPVEPGGFEILRAELVSARPARGGGRPPGRGASPISLSHRRDETRDTPTWRLELRLGPGASAGEINEKIELTTTDPYLPELELMLVGKVEEGIAYSRRLEITSPYPGAVQSGELRIVRLHGPAFKILGMTLNHPHLRADLETVTEGQVYRIRVTVPPETPEGLHSPWLLLRTDRPDLPLLRVKIQARVG